MQEIDIQGLEKELKKSIKGEVRFDDGSRALYSMDASNYRQIPIGVVIPKNKEDVIVAVSICYKYKAPILSRGGGTSLAGQCVNVAVILDMSKYFNKLLSLDPHTKSAVIEPGIVLDNLRNEAEKHHLTFAPDPSTHTHCTLGGMMGNNSCGVHSVMGGKTDVNILEMEILTYDGLIMKVGPTSTEDFENILKEGGRKAEIYLQLKNLIQKYEKEIEEKYPKIPRRVSGYNLPWLLEKNGFDLAKGLVGSECTCVTILEAKVRLIDSPPVKSLLVLGYPDIYNACDRIEEVMAHNPIACEGLDDLLVEDMKKKNMHPKDVKLLPEGKGWLLVQFGGNSKQESDQKARILMEDLSKKPCPPAMKLYDDPVIEEQLKLVRESGLGATARIPNEKDTWPGWEDSAVPIAKLGSYLRDLRKLFKKYNYECSLYGHFGQGCVHTRIDFDLLSKEGLNLYSSFIKEAADLVVSYGGSLSGEHGDGQARAELLPKMFGEDLMKCFREFKKVWDPHWKMNPGKLIDAFSPVENLKLGVKYNPPALKTHFQFAEDDNSFERVATRCVGVGKCRREEGGIMCPSYMVTKEEKHSTRGRAHLLFEMLQGTIIGKKGWKDDSVKEALDLCLACKGCKNECPMNIDMATYKAEFLSHFYKGRLRPRYAYAFGWIYWWSRFAAYLPGLANFFTQTPGISSVSKWIAGAASKRSLPKFAKETFRSNFKNYQAKGDIKVILWTDTFNNNFHPHIASAAVEVLEHLGFKVVLPKIQLCCGRPLYDFGMLKLAKKLLKQILCELKEEIENGTPIIGLEPSCVAVFRDEMVNLFPKDNNAKRLKEQTYLLSEFIQKYAKEYKFSPLDRKALIQGHCHHKSVLKFEHEYELLKRLGLNFEVLNHGCCGMAGSFGFEKDHYDISMKIAEKALVPAIHKESPETLIIANGFSCHEQIKQATGRQVHHIAQILQMSINKERAN